MVARQGVVEANYNSAIVMEKIWISVILAKNHDDLQDRLSLGIIFRQERHLH
jgi:hypothetical protein